jgi:hypothetical protein
VENQNKTKGADNEATGFSRSRLHIEKMFDELEPDNIKIFSQCIYTIDAYRAEIELREQNGTLEEFAALEGEDMEQIFYYAGLSAFQASREDIKYLESAQFHLEILPDGWNLHKHLTLAKIYLYHSRIDESQSQLETYRALLEGEELANTLEPVDLQFHYENLYMGLAASNYAKNDSVKFCEYFDLYTNLIISNQGVPVSVELFLLNFLPYMELNGDNLLFLERLLPLCCFVEDCFGIKYDLWIHAELAYSSGDYQGALDLALQFKASHNSFFKMSGDTFDAGWKEISKRDQEGEVAVWPTDHFMHPAMGTYDHIPIGKRVDDRITSLSIKLELDTQTH